MQFQTIDLVIFIAYCLLIIGIGLWVSRRKGGEEETSQDYFLASKTLPWWAIGASLIASNISAEQFIGMQGSGFAIGLGIATYEFMAAVTLLVVAKFFLPIFIEKGIFTMPQFLEVRYDNRVRTSLAVFWLLVYVFVNLTSVLYLGALAMETILNIPLWWGIVGLAIFAAVYSIYGGLKAVAWTDVVQVIFLAGGGLITTYLALQAVSGENGGFFDGLAILWEKAPEKFDMIISKDGVNAEHYSNLPGISVLIGGMWIANLNYWGCNQYIIQRTLAAKSIQEAQRGVAFAGYLKILMPLIVVIPGIAAYVLDAPIGKPDEAYPWLLANFVPAGIKGLAFAALIAAVVSSLASMVNSTATIFTIDIYKHFINKSASERTLVNTGRLVGGIALVIAVLVAPQLRVLDQAFQFIQEYTGFVSPGVVAIFLLGLFWKRTTANAALWGAILTIPLSVLAKSFLDSMPFIDRMGVVFLVIVAVMVVVSLLETKQPSPKGIALSRSLFHTGPIFNILAIGICMIIAAIYLLFW
ncbi:solute:Na+ symporter, SSS family [Catalinimonas alkaloidigena]|uniref:Solute:Na+ symporter, SSS family n=1 Tax=Catalinimonas alkaloidigena TaxID=1075417 RepID=A0A1G9J585_9BACT|nr:sodium/sugar symporter [Catalinimonas alkaloidigena]SDL32406.1 solute:Na+ symporter, SSS family [Catalinimonas alkaloidigena]